MAAIMTMAMTPPSSWSSQPQHQAFVVPHPFHTASHSSPSPFTHRTHCPPCLPHLSPSKRPRHPPSTAASTTASTTASHHHHHHHEQQQRQQQPQKPHLQQPPSPSPIIPQILALALPALGALALDPLLSLVDTAFVGRLGVSTIAGVSLATLLLNVSFSLFNFLCISITPIVARAVHANPSDPSSASRPIAIALCLAFFLGSCTAITLFSFANPLAVFMSATSDVLPHAVSYLRARAVVIPLTLMTFVANGAMRAFRDLRTPFGVALIANMFNILLDVLLIFHFHLGVLGAALATSVSQAIAFVLLFSHLLSHRRLLLRDIVNVLKTPKLSDVAPMMSAGVLLAIRTCSLLGTVAYATTSAARLGEVALAAFELCRQLWVFNATLLDSLATAAQALVASAMASKRVTYARAITSRAVVLAVVAALSLAFPAIVAGKKLPAIFSNSAQVQHVAALCIRTAAIAAPVNGAVFAMDGVLAACADYKYLAMGIAAAAAAACLAVTAVRIAGGGVVWLWMALNVLMVARAVVLFIRFFSRHGPMSVEDVNKVSTPASAATTTEQT